jgi:ABC-type multidrug transport system ATPase subunit
VLDDATSAIDVQIEQQIHHALETLMVGRTTLIIAHRLSTISLADRVAVLEDGRIVATGTHAELLATEPRYAEILAQAEEEDDDDVDEERQRELDAEAIELERTVAAQIEIDLGDSRTLEAEVGETTWDIDRGVS